VCNAAVQCHRSVLSHSLRCGDSGEPNTGPADYDPAALPLSQLAMRCAMPTLQRYQFASLCHPSMSARYARRAMQALVSTQRMVFAWKACEWTARLLPPTKRLPEHQGAVQQLRMCSAHIPDSTTTAQAFGRSYMPHEAARK
jgi:hypothetical protein